MNFQIRGLEKTQFAALSGLSGAALAEHHVQRLTADRCPGFPCRVSLQDAQPGESVLLLNYEHLPLATPYRSRYAIFVRENAQEARLAVNEIPPVLLSRLLSVRAFSAQGHLLDADVTPGEDLATLIDRLLAPPSVAFLHVHNARPGCYAARVERA
jgi:Protein of unknown function (DUF1203)